MKTGDYVFGAAALFDRDDYGADYMAGMKPWPPTAADAQRAVRPHGRGCCARRFTFARRLGIKTCLGTETPAGDPHARAETTAGGRQGPQRTRPWCRRFTKAFSSGSARPIRWITTGSGRRKAGPGARSASSRSTPTQADFRAAIAAAAKTRGPVHAGHLRLGARAAAEPALFDQTLPKSMPMSCISRAGGQHAGRARLRRGQGPAEVGHSLDGRRSGA